MTAPTPSLDLLLQVRAGFTLQDTSLKRWCRENDVRFSNARDALIGSWNGPKGKALRSKIVRAARVQAA